MFDQLAEVTAAARAIVGGFDPATVTSTDAARLVERFDTLARIATAGRTLAAGRAADGNGWQGSGERSPEEWLSKRSGITRAEARRTLRTAKHLADAPGTDAEFRVGGVSAVQADALSSAAAADPASEADLLRGAASGDSVERTRERSRQVRAAARPDDGMDEQARAHANRFCRIHTGEDGAVRGSFSLTAAAGARLSAALDAAHDRLFQAAQADGRRERADALHADALVTLADATCTAGGDDPTTGPLAQVIIRVDHAAWMRGRTEPGEECTIDGIGPVPVAVARRLGTDATLAALLADGPTVLDLRVAGRTIPTRLRVALVARDRTCVVPGCDAARHLEIHHVVAFADGGPTTLANLCRICTWHHDQITYRGAALIRSCPDGTWCYRPGMDDPGGGPFDDPSPRLFG